MARRNMSPPDEAGREQLAHQIFSIVSGEGGRLAYATLGKRLKLKRHATQIRQLAEFALSGDPRVEWQEEHLLIKSRRAIPMNVRLADLPVVVFDFETSGSTAGSDRAIELGMVALERGKVVHEWESLFNPKSAPVQHYVLKMTGITMGALRKAPTFGDLSNEITQFIGDDLLIAHNLQFDKKFLDAELHMTEGFMPANAALCSFQLSRRLLPNVHSRGVEGLCGYFGLDTGKRHRALDDARATAQIWLKLLEVADDHGIETFGDVWTMMGSQPV